MHNRTKYQQPWDYLHLRFALLQLSPPINFNLPPFCLWLGTLEPRSHLLEVQAPDPNGDFAECNNTPTETMTTMTDLQLLDNIKESISLD